MSNPHLIFAKNVPASVRRIAKRWVRRLRLEDWTIIFTVVPEDELHSDIMAVVDVPCSRRATSVSIAQYLKADIEISDSVGRDEMEYVIQHELRHLGYSWFEHIVRQAGDGRPRLDLPSTLRLLSDKTEELIERDCKIFSSAWRR